MRAIAHADHKRATSSPTAMARGSILLGLATIATAFGGFGAWAALAPLQSAAIAPGEVVVSSHRKTVQHLEGGIIAAIDVRDGSLVETGEVLVRLDDTRARADLGLLQGRYDEALERRARLIAERDGVDRVAFPPALADRRHIAHVRAAWRGQVELFEARRASLQGKTAILRQRVAQFREQIVALDAQQEAERGQLGLIREELADVRELLEKGLERKPRLLALERTSLEIEGLRAAHLGQIAEVRQSITGTELEIASLRIDRVDEVTQELKELQAEIQGLEERLLAARDRLWRTVIRAPQDGIIVGSRFHTVGGVIGPGEPILDLTPQLDRLIVEARLRPEDIDTVHAGLPVQVRLTAFKQRVTPTVDGEVILVSADRLEDEASGEAYYNTRIEIDPASLAAVADAALYPGMPAEAIIITGERTALDYLLSPITQSLQRALLEP